MGDDPGDSGQTLPTCRSGGSEAVLNRVSRRCLFFHFFNYVSLSRASFFDENASELTSIQGFPELEKPLDILLCFLNLSWILEV